VQKALKTLSYANQAANTNILCDANYPVIGFRHCLGRTPFGTVAALVANFNFVIASIRSNTNSAFSLIGCFEKGF